MAFRGLALLLFVSSAIAQSGLSTLEGIVKDQTGAILPQAKLELRLTQTGQRWATVADAQGRYAFRNVSSGTAELQAHFEGMQSYAQTVNLVADQRLTIDVTLGAATLSEQIKVIASAELLQPSRVTQSVTFSSKALTELPTASRNYTHMIVGEAGVTANLADRTGRGLNMATSPGAQDADGSQSLNPSVNGARPTNNSLSINGIDATNMLNGNGSLANNISIPLDSVEYIEVQTSQFSALKGRNGGGNIEIVSKGGTNGWHGSVFHFLQNEKLNAQEFFLNRGGQTRPKFRRNESGATFTGPIRKDRTFFFVSAQRLRFDTGYAQRAIAQTAIPVGLGDTRTRESIAAVANRWLQSGAAGPQGALFTTNFLTAIRRFPADQIPGLERKFFDSVDPANLRLRTLTPLDIHPVAINVLNQRRNGRFLLPSADPSLRVLPGSASFGEESELVQSFPTFFKNWAGSATVDHNFTATNRLRLNYAQTSQFVEEAFGWANSSPSPTQGQSPSYTAALNHYMSFGPKWLNHLRGGWFQLFNTRISVYRDIFNSTLGIFNPLEPAIGGLASLMPTIDISTQRSTAGIGNAWDFFDRQRTANMTNVTSYTSGKHTISFGPELRRTTLAGEYMARTNGDLDYDNWVFFFTGHGASGGGSDLDMGDTRRNFILWDTSLFVQDDWRVRRGLTINAGLRWDFYGLPRDTQGRIGNYYPREVADKLGVQPGFYVPGDSAFFQPNFDPLKIGIVVAPNVPIDLRQVYRSPTPSTLFSDFNNVAPRLGFAWQPQRFQRLVLRGGYGMYYERTGGAIKGDMQLSSPFFIYQNVPSPMDMANPYPEVNINPFQVPYNVTILRDANGGATWRRFDGTPFPATSPFSPKNHTFIDPFLRTPYTQQWTFNVQIETLSNHVLDVRYVGSRGTGLLGRLNLTQPRNPREFPVNGFDDFRTRTGALINPSFFVRPDLLGLNHNGGFRWLSNWGHSNYNALQANYRIRKNTLFTNIGYAFQKSIDNVSVDRGIIQHDAFNSRLNRGLSDFNRAHRLTAQWIYELPLRLSGRALQTAFGGWNLGGMVTLQSGSMVTVTGNTAANAVFAQPATVRPSFAPGRTLPDAILSGRIQDRLERYFDPAVFVDSTDTWGNAGRNLIAGPFQRQLDLTITKRFRIREASSAEFRWELYNATNTPVFGNPASALAVGGPGTAGRITTTIGGPRTMQAAIRVLF